MRKRTLLAVLLGAAVAGSMGRVARASEEGVFLTNELRLFNDLKEDVALAMFIDSEAEPRCIAEHKRNCQTAVTIAPKGAASPVTLIKHEITIKQVSDGKVCGVIGPLPVALEAEVTVTKCKKSGVSFDFPQFGNRHK